MNCVPVVGAAGRQGALDLGGGAGSNAVGLAGAEAKIMLMRPGLPLLDVSFAPGLGADARRHFRNQAALCAKTARVLRRAANT